jgi:ubiquinone/menaquinone biosynthesis C-methylase UbiE
MSEQVPRPMTLGAAFKPESIDDDAVAQMVSILDEQDAMPSIERLRVWALDKAQVQPGERVLDVGSGTGTMTRRLAAAVGPEGTALGIEPNGMLRGVAEARAAADGTGATFCQGLATEIPLPDASVDLVWCERVLQHVPDAQAAITEMVRVLRPGGRAVLLDSDHESRVNSDIDPEVARSITVAFMGQLANADAARHIPRQAMAAGLVVDPDIGSSGVVFPQELLLGFPMLKMAADQAVADGSITREQADEAVRSQSEAAREGWAFSTVTVFGFLCRKP